jgi:hypothetical protein
VAKFCNLAKKNEKNEKNVGLFIGIFSPFFEIKIIKLATSRPTHFLGCQL